MAKPTPFNIDSALIAKLNGDAELRSYCPGGVFWAIAPPNATAVVLVSRIPGAGGHDMAEGGRSHYRYLYLVQATLLSTVPGANSNGKQAAARIDDLLSPEPPDPPATLPVTGLTLMGMYLDPDLDTVHEAEQDDVDPTVLWYHWGGYYWIWMST